MDTGSVHGSVERVASCMATIKDETYRDMLKLNRQRPGMPSQTESGTPTIEQLISDCTPTKKRIYTSPSL